MSTSSSSSDLTGSVVVGIDGSQHAARALRWAADQAVLEGRRLALVAVGEAAARSVADAVVVTQALHRDLPVLPVVESGDPREVLLEASDRAHLLVLGSRGRGAVASLLLGSVSSAVSAHASCPVVVCRPEAEGDQRLGIVVGADGTRESLPVLEFAYRQASLRHLPLTVLHSFWDAAVAVAQYEETRGRAAVQPDLEHLRASLSASAAGLAETYPDVFATFTLRHGFADEALSPRHGGWDMVVVGRHPMTSMDRLLTGSVATAVLERARATVAVVPEASPAEHSD
ncbi:putative UspA domain protein [metagenome]|jgi:nucleotide-binding universal stress UspA family protein|uniref:Putative UspA domain protein n=1 Tax=metagenome TaxID=256318 RepID=A0A2P2CD08_9ZZZZ